MVADVVKIVHFVYVVVFEHSKYIENSHYQN